MTSKIVYQGFGSGKGGTDLVLVAGLEWRVLSADTPAALRERGQERSATHAALMRPNHPPQAPRTRIRTRSWSWPWQRRDARGGEASTQARPVAGFYVNLDGSAPPAKAHSLAAAFAGWMAEHPNALLCYALPASERQRLNPPLPEGTWSVVAVVAGSPVVDAVFANGDEAHALIASYLLSHPGISIVSNDTVRYPQTVKADNILPALVNYALTHPNAGTRLRAIPADIRKWVLITLVAAVATGAFLQYQKHQQEAERQRVVQERLNNDPAKLYTAALRAQAPHLGVSRTSLIGAMDAATRLPLRVGGWQLKGILCDTACTALYLRQFGTLSKLASAIEALGSGYTLQAPLPGDIDLDTATVVIPTALEPQGPQPEAPTQPAFMQSQAINQLQDWKTAGLSLQMRPPQLWPQVPNVPATFKGANALGVGGFEVSGIALPLLKEVIGAAPANVIWKGFKIELSAQGPTANPMDAAKAQATGVYYVKQ